MLGPVAVPNSEQGQIAVYPQPVFRGGRFPLQIFHHKPFQTVMVIKGAVGKLRYVDGRVVVPAVFPVDEPQLRPVFLVDE